MAILTDSRRHAVPRILVTLGFTVALYIYTSTATVAVGSVLKIEEARSSRILYFEESGAIIIVPVSPIPSDIRAPLPPLPAQKEKTISGRPAATGVSTTVVQAKPKQKR